MKNKVICKYCGQLITVSNNDTMGMCGKCRAKLPLVRKLLKMVKNTAEKVGRNG
jgi:hypothetical protein